MASVERPPPYIQANFARFADVNSICWELLVYDLRLYTGLHVI